MAGIISHRRYTTGPRNNLAKTHFDYCWMFLFGDSLKPADVGESWLLLQLFGRRLRWKSEDWWSSLTFNFWVNFYLSNYFTLDTLWNLFKISSHTLITNTTSRSFKCEYASNTEIQLRSVHNPHSHLCQPRGHLMYQYFKRKKNITYVIGPPDGAV